MSHGVYGVGTVPYPGIFAAAACSSRLVVSFLVLVALSLSLLD